MCLNLQDLLDGSAAVWQLNVKDRILRKLWNHLEDNDKLWGQLQMILWNITGNGVTREKKSGRKGRTAAQRRPPADGWWWSYYLSEDGTRGICLWPGDYQERSHIMFLLNEEQLFAFKSWEAARKKILQWLVNLMTDTKSSFIHGLQMSWDSTTCSSGYTECTHLVDFLLFPTPTTLKMDSAASKL